MAIPASPGLAANDKAASSQDRANGLVTGTLTAVGPGKALAVWGPFNVLVYGVLAQSLVVAASGTNAGVVGSGTNIAKGDSVSTTLAPAGTTILSIAGTDVTFAFPTQTWPGRIVAGVAAISFGATTLPGGQSLGSLVGSAVSDPNGYFGSGVTVTGVGADGQSVTTSAAPTTAPTLAYAAPIEFALTARCLTAGTDAAAKFTGAATPIGQATSTFQLEQSLDGGATWVCRDGSIAGTKVQFTDRTGAVAASIADPEAGALYRINMIAYTAVTNVTPNYRLSTTGQAGMSLQVPTSA